MTGSTFCFFFLRPLPLEAVGGVAVATGAAPSFAFISTSMITGSSFFTTGGDRSGLTSGGCSSVRNESQKSSEEHEKVFWVAVRVMMVLVRVFWVVYESFWFWMVFSSGTAKTSCTYMLSRAVTIHQTHDSVRITIFDPRFGSYHDFFVGGKKKKKKDF